MESGISRIVELFGSTMKSIFGPFDDLVDKLPLAQFAADAIKDTAHMLPFLLVIFYLIEFFEVRFSGRMRTKISDSKKAGPLLGAILGCVPQCGFSVVISTLYTRRYVSVGTLLAVYLSTSDEAIPIILSKPEQAPLVLQIIGAKIAIALLGGYGADLLFRQSKNTCAVSGEAQPVEIRDEGCCSHHLQGEAPGREIFLHPLIHTAKITGWIFAITLIINFIVFKVGGEENLGKAMLVGTVFQPVIAALIGLIPNCAASVAITMMYLKGGLSFGSAIAGLCAGGGLGLLVLFKENQDHKDTLRIVGLLLAVSIGAGILLQLFS